MKQLLEDYKRRLKTVTDMQDKFKSNGSISDERKSERLTTKASEYRTFIADLERAIAQTEPAKPSAIKGKLGKWSVDVCRTSYAHLTIEVYANSEAEAVEKALDEAGDHEFTEKDADYSAPDGGIKMKPKRVKSLGRNTLKKSL